MFLRKDMTQIKKIKILDETILPGESKTINMEVAKLHTMTKLKIPIIVERSKTEGPTVLLTAGLHGDEINGVEIVRQLISKNINKPKTGTLICIPVVNIFGFMNQTREFPDGRDLNRVFPMCRIYQRFDSAEIFSVPVNKIDKAKKVTKSCNCMVAVLYF